ESAPTRSTRAQTAARLSRGARSTSAFLLLFFFFACLRLIGPRLKGRWKTPMPTSFHVAPALTLRMVVALARSRGGIGRRVRLRTVWGNPWRFESSREQFTRRSDALAL